MNEDPRNNNWMIILVYLVDVIFFLFLMLAVSFIESIIEKYIIVRERTRLRK